MSGSVLTSVEAAADHSPKPWPGRIGPGDEVTLGEAAELLGLAPREVLVLVETDRLPARTNCSVVRISLADVEIYRRTPHPSANHVAADP